MFGRCKKWLAERGAHTRVLAKLVACVAPLVFPAFAVAGAVELPVPLPALPPPHVRYPGLFDERGCALLQLPGPGAPKTICPRIRTLPETRVAGNEWRRLLGFVGPYYASKVRGTGVVVLPESIGAGTAEEWSAVGMVRNESLVTVRDIAVTARLVGDDGAVLATATSSVPVRDVRPGEPAPFAMASSVSRRAVVEVRWSVRSHAARQSVAATRMVEITPTRVVALGARRPAGIGSATPPARGTTPAPREIAWGFVRSWAPRTIHRPAIVALELDAEGRGVMLLPGLVTRRSGDWRASRSVLRRGDVAPFVLLLPDDAIARSDRPGPQRLVFWESAS